MSNDKYYDTILAILTEKGELGVNEIARLADMPLSTVQKYLERQTYFKKTERRKWDLPDNVNADIKTETLVLMVNSVENSLLILKSQLEELTDDVQNSLGPVKTLKRGVESIKPPVASKSSNIDRRLLELDKKAKDSYEVFKAHIKNVPEEYRTLILKLDILGLMLTKGREYLFNGEHEDLVRVLGGQSDILSDKTLKLLESYQKEA